jgi:hypothetical protein
MGCQPSEVPLTEVRPPKGPDHLDRFQEAARRGDWSCAQILMSELTRQPVPVDPIELGEYLRRLQHALAVARASRAAAARSLSRLRAVAGFSRAARQNRGDPASY